jgi:hypothetical protein
MSRYNQIRSRQLKKKKCSRCGIEQDVTEFWACKSSRDGLRSYCRTCGSKMAHARYLRNPEQRRKSTEAWRKNNPEHQLQWRKDNSFKCLISSCISRARKKNVTYDSRKMLSDYLKPIYNKGVCECCHCELEANIGNGKQLDNSFSIDRIIPELGYIIGNVAIICKRCNQIKNNGTWQEHIMIANWQKEKEDLLLLSQNNQTLFKQESQQDQNHEQEPSLSKVVNS